MKIVSGPSAEPVTVEYVKKILHWIDTDTDTEAVLEDYIKAARELIEGTYDISVVKKTYEETFRQKDVVNDRYILRRPPHSEITSLKKVDKDGTETDVDYYVFKEFAYELQLTTDIAGYYKARFTSGYSTIPSLIKVAIAEQVGDWYEGHTDPDKLSNAVRIKMNKYSNNPVI